MEFDKLLKLVVEKGASDLFITAGRPPTIKINGKLFAASKNALSPEQSREIVLGVMNKDQQDAFKRDHECNFAINTRGLGRFRVSAFYQRNLIGMVLRRIEVNIPKVAELGLPPILEQLAMTKRGLIIFVGATGTGKSTSLAAMIGHRNENSSGHIISIEDPIEYIHQHRGCIITQREVGMDTDSFEVALKNTLRQAPDVIMIGEVRQRETMEAGGDLRRNRSPVPVHAARQQRQPGARPDHPLLPERSARPDLDGPVAEPEGDHRAAVDPDGRRSRSPRRGRGTDQHAVDGGPHPQRRSASAERADDEVDRTRHADVRPGVCIVSTAPAKFRTTRRSRTQTRRTTCA